MVFSSDRTPSQLNGIDDRLKSRLSSSAIVEMKQPSNLSRKKLISFYISLYNFSLEEKIIDFLAESISGDVRKIVGALKTLFSLSELYGEEISIEYCKKYLNHLLMSKRQNIVSSPSRIIEVLSNHTQIEKEDILSKKKTRVIANCRQIGMYLMRKYTQLSISEIGAFLGGKKSPTIIHGYSKIEKLIKSKDKKTIDIVESVLEII